MVSPRWLSGVGVQIQETDSLADTVLRVIVPSHSTNFLRSFRLMPARTDCLEPPCRAALLSALLWLAATPLTFGQNPNTAEARESDVAADKDQQAEDGGLPSGLIQTHKVPPEWNIVDELVTEGDETNFRKVLEKALQDALKSPTLTEAEKKAIDAGTKHLIYRFTMKKYFEEETPKKADKPGAVKKGDPPRDRLHDLRKKLIDSIKNNPKLTKETREYFLKQIMDRSAELLENNLIVRQNIILLLGQLPADNGIIAKGIEPAPYVPAYSVLLKVIKDEQQHEVLKIDALLGLLRICRLGLPLPDLANDKKRAEIAMVLVTELAKKDTHFWYQVRLAECLGAAGVTYDPTNKTNPIVLQTLAEVVTDKTRHWWPRCEAAKAIGRLPLDNGLNMTPVIFEIVKLGYDMAQRYSEKPKSESWANYFILGLYMTFKAENGAVRVPGGKRKPGLLEALPQSREVKDAYEQILQMAWQFVDNPGKPFDASQLKGFDDWLRNHEPTNRRITGSTPPIGGNPDPVKVNGKSTMPPTNPVAGP